MEGADGRLQISVEVDLYLFLDATRPLAFFPPSPPYSPPPLFLLPPIFLSSLSPSHCPFRFLSQESVSLVYCSFPVFFFATKRTRRMKE